MATTLSPDSDVTSHHPQHDGSCTKVFDDPDADIILRSCDAQDFRVLRLYILKSSPVLKGVIQAATSNPSDVAVIPDVTAPLPVVKMSDRGTIISCLLTFIFPMSPTLPPTVEEIMELLSVAQKYEMSSVLTHIRGNISLRDPPFIRQENALHVHSLALQYGLRHEAARAARISIQFSLTIENLVDKLDGLTSASLRGLQKYHQDVRDHLALDLGAFRTSGAGIVLEDLHCLSIASSGIPSWLDDYIVDIVNAPSSFDPIIFQLALASHVGTDSEVQSYYGGHGRSTAVSMPVSQCQHCKNIPVETLRAFWADLTSVVYGCFEKAESDLSVLGGQLHSQNQITSPRDTPPLPECLDMSEADVIIQSSDHVNFRVHKLILASSSQFFKDMFSLPQPPDAGEVVDGLPVAHLPEDAELIRALITILYPIPSQIPVSYDDTLALLASAKKYDMDGVGSAIRAELSHKKLPVLVGPQAFRAYAIASSHRLIPEMDSAARHTLDYPMTFEYLGDQLEFFEGWALGDLARFRRLCRNNLVSCFESFLDTHNGPSTIWARVGCKKEVQHEIRSKSRLHAGRRKVNLGNGNQDEPSLPAWLRDFLSGQVEELMEGFTNALTKPSSIREEYLRALQAHNGRYSDGCTPCLNVHVREGSEYSKRLVEELEKARNIRMPPSLLSPLGVRSWDASTETDI